MEQGILKRLRIKFIAVNMGLALLVLVITFGTICALDHASDERAPARSFIPTASSASSGSAAVGKFGCGSCAHHPAAVVRFPLIGLGRRNISEDRCHQ